jgi:hypothetical protein
LKHGELISREQRTTYGNTETLVDAITGETVYHGPMSAVTGPVIVRWCEACGEVEQDGFLALMDMDCPKCNRLWDERDA